jgi:hypothetical protein
MAQILDIQMRSKRFVDLTSSAFRTKLVKIASRLGLDPSALATIMMFETATTMSPSIQNPYTKATGLIQFMPPTATNMGTSVDKLKAMSAVDQLDWVEKYFKPWAGRLHTPQDHYLAVFLPSLMGTALSHVVASAGSKLYDQNSGFDGSKKGYYTTGDIVYPITSAYSAAQARPPVYVPGFDWGAPVRLGGLTFVFGMLGAAMGYGVSWSLKSIRE